MSIKKKTPQQIGKDFEDKIQAALKALQQKTRMTFIRLYDSHSAGALLPAQPGDFCGVAQGTGFLIEAKSSAKASSLHGNKSILSDNMGGPQAASMRLWHRAGATVLVPFLGQETGAVEIWDGKYLADIYNAPRVKPNRDEGLLMSAPDWQEKTLLTVFQKLLIKDKNNE